MKKILQYILIFSLVGAFSACTDDEDYRDLNQTPYLDSPAFLMQSDKGDTIKGGETITFTINLIESPAGYDSVSVTTSRGEGTTSVTGFEQLVGQTGGGEFTVTATPPASFVGDYEVTITVYDAQRNDKGVLARRQFAESESFLVEYPLELPTFELTFDGADPIIRGGTGVFTISIEAPAGIDTVVVLPSSGTVELDAASLNAALGQTSATVMGTFNASDDAEDVGDVEFEVRVRDREQQALVIENFTETTVFEFEAPEFDVTFEEQQVVINDTLNFEMDFTNVPTGVDTVLIEILDDFGNSGEDVGTVGFVNFDEVQGNTSGILKGYVIASSARSIFDISFTVVNGEGNQATSTIKSISVIGCDAPDISGTYTTVTNGTSTDPDAENNPTVDLASTVTIKKGKNGLYTISDYFAGIYVAWYGTVYGYPGVTARTIIYCSEEDGIITPDFNDRFGDPVQPTGSIDPVTGKITISWINDYGDEATTVFTPQ